MVRSDGKTLSELPEIYITEKTIWQYILLYIVKIKSTLSFCPAVLFFVFAMFRAGYKVGIPKHAKYFCSKENYTLPGTLINYSESGWAKQFICMPEQTVCNIVQ